LGATIANYYTKLAMEKCKLPGIARHLAWLDLDSEEGQEYWLAMNLAGDYASACHHQIHKKVAKSLSAQPISMVENHHNFAWKEIHDGKEVIVHRKGATPAGKGVLGIIPGSMIDPGFVVSGAAEISSLNSASHGAGRKMSRSAAKNVVTKKMLDDVLKQRAVTLIGGDLDEAPMAYKDIRAVMQSQQELVNIEGIFLPKIVRMA
jgi:tRNA-splicing ligase RtcB